MTTTPLQTVPSASTESGDLREAVVAWADSCAELASSLAADLRRGQDFAEIEPAFVALARQNSALLETVGLLLDQAARK